MATIEENKSVWDGWYAWDESGDEWSGPWGSADMQWYGTILPRIHRHLPAGTILEIAPGHGRWTNYLKNLCNRLIVVDLSESCIEACRKRFEGDKNIEYHVNDGKSLDMVDDATVDFVYSYDSLVHAEKDVIEAYLEQIARKLKRGGTAFLHHSNMLAARKKISWHRLVPGRMRRFLRGKGFASFADHWRAESASSELVRLSAESVGLACLSQEMVNWRTDRLIDCLSVLSLPDDHEKTETRILENRRFMKEARYLARLGRLYGRPRSGS